MTATVLPTAQVGALLDLENLLHAARRRSGTAVRAQLRLLMAQIRTLGDVRHAVGCCDFWLAKVLTPTAAELGVRVFPGRLGKDRADAELLRRAADIPPSADVLVVGSGDGTFAPLVARAALAGRHTVVIARTGSVSAALRAAAHEVIELPDRVVDLAPAA
jgi:hypothetical protein